MLTMQDAILALTEFWASHGCLIAQPANTEVGAGTLNPHTALRVLGPEPWKVAYVEPSVRPDDSRYGENPNRLQTHTQFQVILKPEPGNAQEIYLASLEALGIDLADHDVRFVEDNWASPALGAWGLGWEVWLNGLEITQFTYFQQSGGLALDPVSVEITYGLERILMAFQEVRHFSQIAYNAEVSYGEAFGQGEYEMSRYYLDEADVEMTRNLFDLYGAEAERLLARALPIPAHSFVLKCSHAFNILDSRGAVSTTERAKAFARMRKLAQQVAESWVERRAELGHPLGVFEPPAPAEPSQSTELAENNQPEVFALEVGFEELPAAEVEATATNLAVALTEALNRSALSFGPVRSYGTPRRAIVVIEDVAPREADRLETVIGPRWSAAFDDSGQPTKALIGFCRSRQADPSQIKKVDERGGEYVAFDHLTPGRPAGQVLAEAAGAAIAGMRSTRNMKWRSPGLSFSRPIRWILGLLGGEVVPITLADLASDRLTRPLRGQSNATVEIDRAASFVSTLGDLGIEVDPVARKQTVLTRGSELAASLGGVLDAPDALVDEVVNLTEAPNPVLGRFDEEYLTLPEPVLESVMRKHQRYLTVRSAAGTLLPAFIAVANGPCRCDTVVAGNEAVLRARFADAAFFYRADCQKPPDQMREGLEKLLFEARLGSMADRAGRIGTILVTLATRLDLSEDDRRTAERTGQLAKFDLASEMVIEMSSLAGVMAREYALVHKEPPAVATALYEMELPRHFGDALPGTMVGLLAALADRADLLAGLFAIGATPTGSSDPLGMRRSALGVIALMRELASHMADHHRGAKPLGLRELLETAGRQQAVEFGPEHLDMAMEFLWRRMEQDLVEKGYSADHVRACRPAADRPAAVYRRVAELRQLKDEPGFVELKEAIERSARIIPSDWTPESKVGPDGKDLEPAEAELQASLAAVTADLDYLSPDATLAELVATLGALVPPISRFFDELMVMVEDQAVRNRRLLLLAAVRDLSHRVLDWTTL
jgi:glycyl-tRNA synthetase